MSFLIFESYKILNRKNSFILLLITTLIFPLIIKIIAHFSITDNHIAEGLFADYMANGVIMYSQIYFFLPAWIIIFIGQELQNGHAQRVVFLKSRRFYVFSKIVYCIIITAVFSVIGIFAFLIAIKTAPYQNIHINLVGFSLQLVVATFAYSILLLVLVSVVRSPIISYVVYIGWLTVEGIIFVAIKGLYNYEVKWLPFHFVRTFYSYNGHASSENYYNPFVVGLSPIIGPVCFIFLLILFFYFYFSKADLKQLSD